MPACTAATCGAVGLVDPALTGQEAGEPVPTSGLWALSSMRPLGHAARVHPAGEACGQLTQSTRPLGLCPAPQDSPEGGGPQEHLGPPCALVGAPQRPSSAGEDAQPSSLRQQPLGRRDGATVLAEPVLLGGARPWAMARTRVGSLPTHVSPSCSPLFFLFMSLRGTESPKGAGGGTGVRRWHPRGSGRPLGGHRAGTLGLHLCLHAGAREAGGPL